MEHRAVRLLSTKRILRFLCRYESSSIQEHHFSSSSSQYGLEKKWAYYNQESIDREASSKLRLLMPTQLAFRSEDGTHLLKSSQFMQAELPRRIARRVKDFQSLPYVVALNPTLQEVYELYLRAFDHLTRFRPIKDLQDEREYAQLLVGLLDDHKEVVTLLAKAFHDVKHLIPYHVLGSLTDRTLTSRLGIRLLAEHHIALRGQKRENYVGIIYMNMSPKSLVEKCVHSSRRLCEQTYGRSPPVYVSGHTKARFPHIPAPIEYIVLELLKNAMKAVITRHGQTVSDLPPVEITICNNEEDFIIKISDQGGGISDDDMNDVFRYSFSTTQEEENMEYTKTNGGPLDGLVRSANANAFGGSLSGYGFGLPCSLAYAKFFGGSVKIMPMYGLGTEVFLRLSHITKQDAFRI